MSVYITGDTHGEYNRMALIDKKMQAGDYLIVCGDWGYLFHNSYSERRFLDDLEQKPYTILFVDGNHENFPAIYDFPKVTWKGGKVHQIRKNIMHLCRGQVFEIENMTFFTFGGGYSIDRATRISGVSWWIEEMPSELEYAEGLHNLMLHDYKVDFILTHTANIETVRKMATLSRYGQVKSVAIEEVPLNLYLEDEVFAKTEYRKWFFGHFHSDMAIEETRQRAIWFDMVKLEWNICETVETI